MSKPEELSLNSQEVQSVEEHLSRNELKEVWQIIQANCQKLPSLLNEEIKGVFQDAFNAMSSDFASLLEKVEVNSQETWERFKDFFENFMEALKPVQEAIVNGAKEAWGQIVKIYDIVATYCDKKIKEFSTAVVDLAQETKNWVETTGASAFKKAGQDIGNFASDAASQTESAFKKAGQDIDSLARSAASEGENTFQKIEKEVKSWVEKIEKIFKSNDRER